MFVRWDRLVAAVALAVTPALGAQSARDHIARGDTAYAAGRVQTSIEQYKAALLAEPKNYDALWKASRSAVDIAEALGKGKAQDSVLAEAQRYGDAAVAANPRDAQGHFVLSRAAGRKALSVGQRERISYAKIVRAEALESLKYDSSHVGALHVLGMWNAEVMRVNGLARRVAIAFMGADVFALASWAEAQRLLERAVAMDPDRLVHRLDLAGIVADRGDKARARALYTEIVNSPDREFVDPTYKKLAAERLKRL
jgi:tetratricopeptide (TPR) repeat protein